jgi:hypothetical protein
MTDTPKTTADKVTAPAVSEPVSAPKAPADGVKASGDSKVISEPPAPGPSDSKSQAPAPLKT